MRRMIVGTLFVLSAFGLPAFVAAQTTNADLQSTVRAMLLSDPRAASLTPAQLDAMTVSLTAEAEQRGITAEDVLWRPQQDVLAQIDQQGSAAPTADQCGDDYLCKLNAAFGFSGDDITIPLWLGISSAILILLIVAMIEVHRNQHAATQQPASGQ